MSNSLHSNSFCYEFFLSLIFTFNSLKFERIALMKIFMKFYEQKNHSHVAQHEFSSTFFYYKIFLHCAHFWRKTTLSQWWLNWLSSRQIANHWLAASTDEQFQHETIHIINVSSFLLIQFDQNIFFFVR